MHTDLDPYFVPQLGLLVAILGSSRVCTSHFRGTCLREVCRGSSDEDFGGPMTLPHYLRGCVALPEPSLELPGAST